MTIQVPKPQKSKAQLAMERAIASSDSISLTLRRALDGVGKALTQEAGVAQISQISPDLGDMTSGAFWALDDEGRVRVVMSAKSLFEELGISAYFAGFDENENPQFWMDADTGAAVFGGGANVLNKEGFNQYGLGYAIQQQAETNGNWRWGRLEMIVPDGATAPVWALSFNGPAGSELLSNGDFSGGATDWTGADDGNGLWFLTGGTARFVQQQFTTDQGNGTQTHARIAITAGVVYQVLVKIRGTSTLSQLVTAKWYDASTGGTLLRTDTIFSGAITSAWKEYVGQAEAPSGATYCEVTLTAATNKNGTSVPQPTPKYVEFDDVSLTQVAISHRIYLADDGVKIDGAPAAGIAWDTAAEAGPGQNRNVTNTYATQIMVLDVFEAMRVTGFKWDVRTAAAYQLHKLFSPNIANSIRQLWSGTVAAPGEVTMNFSSPEVLLPGTYYFGLTTGSAVSWWDYNSATWLPATNPDFRLNGIYYNTSNFASYTPGARLIRGRGIWA